MGDRRTPAERTLDAEVRAVEHGHHARLAGDGHHFHVRGEDHPDLTYSVNIKAVGETIVFTCDHAMVLGFTASPQRTFVPCQHAALCARRLEREGLLRWDGGRWLPTEKAYELGVERPVGDPFEGLPR